MPGVARIARQVLEVPTGGSITLRDDSSGVARVSPEDLAKALAELSVEVRRDAPLGGVLITIDEMQVAAHPDLTLLAGGLHALNRLFPDARVIFAGTGLPHTGDVLDAAGVTHPDRLFDIRPIPLLLNSDDARFAIDEPARMRQVIWEPAAADMVVEISRGYPAHLQSFAHHVWNGAVGPSAITHADAARGIPRAAAEIEQRTLAPRFDRRTPRQVAFLTALAVYEGRASVAALAEPSAANREHFRRSETASSSRETSTFLAAAKSL